MQPNSACLPRTCRRNSSPAAWATEAAVKVPMLRPGSLEIIIASTIRSCRDDPIKTKCMFSTFHSRKTGNTSVRNLLRRDGPPMTSQNGVSESHWSDTVVPRMHSPCRTGRSSLAAAFVGEVPWNRYTLSPYPAKRTNPSADRATSVTTSVRRRHVAALHTNVLPTAGACGLCAASTRNRFSAIKSSLNRTSISGCEGMCPATPICTRRSASSRLTASECSGSWCKSLRISMS